MEPHWASHSCTAGISVCRVLSLASASGLALAGCRWRGCRSRAICAGDGVGTRPEERATRFDRTIRVLSQSALPGVNHHRHRVRDSVARRVGWGRDCRLVHADLRTRDSLGRRFSAAALCRIQQLCQPRASTRAEDAVVRWFDFRVLARALPAASRVQCIYRGRRNAGGPCCEDALVPRFMVTSLIRCLILLAVLTAAVMPGPSRYSSVWAQSTHGATAQNEPQASIGAGAHIQPLRPGFDFPRQTLRYEAEYRFWTAGVASLRVERNGSQEHLSATADSSGVVALLFRVQDRFNSYFDAQTLCSARVTKHTEEGSHWRETTITFDYGRGKSVLEEKNLKTGQSKRVENDIPGCVTDVVSGLLYVASLPLQPDATYSFPLSDGGKTVTIQAHVEGKEQIKTPAGTFQTIRVGPQGDYSALKNRGRVLIWYSDDARHLPIQMQARMLWGTLTVYLTSIDK